MRRRGWSAASASPPEPTSAARRPSSSRCTARRRLRPADRAAGFPPGALVRHGDHPAAGAIPYVLTTARQAGARRRGGGCVHLVRTDVSHREAHGDGVDEMMRNAECGMRNAEWALRNAKRGMRNAEWAWRTPAGLLLALGRGPWGL